MQVIGTNFTYMIVMTIHCHSLLCYRRSKHTVVAYKEAIYVFGGDNGYDTIMKKELLLCVQQLRVACFICLLLYSKLWWALLCLYIYRFVCINFFQILRIYVIFFIKHYFPFLAKPCWMICWGLMSKTSPGEGNMLKTRQSFNAYNILKSRFFFPLLTT